MKKTNVLAVAAIAALYAVQGMAGDFFEVPVVVNLEERSAHGAQTSARFANNDVENIGCGATVFSDGLTPVFEFGFCQATDAEDVSFSCSTLDPDLVGAINAVANYGYIRFAWNENGECISVRNSTQSRYIPDFAQAKSKKSKKSKK